jgi:hypothetical protein
MSTSQYQAKKILENSKFWSSQYRNFNATSDEAQEFLKNNGFVISDSENSDWTYIATAVVDFDSTSYKSTVPITSTIFYTSILPQYVDESEKLNSPEYQALSANKIAEAEANIEKKKNEQSFASQFPTWQEWKKAIKEAKPFVVDREDAEWIEWYERTINPSFKYEEETIAKYLINS